MDNNDLLILIITALVTGFIGFSYWMVQFSISRRKEKKDALEKQKDRINEKWLGPGGVAPKDVDESVRIAKREGRDVRLPQASGNIIIRIIIFFFLVSITSYFVLTTQTGNFAVGTKTPIVTLTHPSNATPSPSPSEYYMIILDASSTMNNNFYGISKWEVALTKVDNILNGLNPSANYGLIVIGGKNTDGASDPCENPSNSTIHFSTSSAVWNYTSQIQPQGGGSYYAAFTTAVRELENLPTDTLKNLIFITGVSDSCQNRDEWSDIERAIQISPTTDIYSEIIILDEDGSRSQSIAESIYGLQSNINVLAAQSIQDVLGSDILIVTNPKNGSSLNCLTNENCIVPITIQWITEEQATSQGLYLSIWLKPYPGDANYLFYSQTPVIYLGNGVWQSNPVFVGQIGDPSGTPYAIYAIVTNQAYGTGIQTSPLPAHSKEALIEVTK